MLYALAHRAGDDRDLLGGHGRTDQDDGLNTMRGGIERVGLIEVANDELGIGIGRPGRIAHQRSRGLMLRAQESDGFGSNLARRSCDQNHDLFPCRRIGNVKAIDDTSH